MDLLAAKYFNRKHFPLKTRIKWWIKGFIAFRELQKRNKKN